MDDLNFATVVFITVLGLLIAWWIIGCLHMSVIAAICMVSCASYMRRKHNTRG